MTRTARRLWRRAPLAVAAAAMLAGAAGPAQSAFPGDNGLIAFTSTRDGGFPELFLLDPATLAVTKVAEVAAGGGVPENPVWSPDGTRIAFARAGDIEVFELANGGLQTIASIGGGQPTWSPEGDAFAFSRSDAGNQGIWRVDADGTNMVRLTTGEHQDPAWSPDGGSIAFTQRRHFAEAGFILTDAVYAVNPDGTGKVRMDREIYGVSNADPAWSPDGQQLALTEEVGGGRRISTLEVDLNEGPNPVTDFENDFSPAWSPDGTKIVFERVVPGGRALFTVTPGSAAAPTALTGTPPALDATPDWQPLPTTPADPTCSIGVTRVDEGNGGSAGQASFTVNCDNPTAFTHTLDWATVDAPGHHGTALPVQDYTPAAGVISLPPGPTRTHVLVPVVGDTAAEPHETIWVRISSNAFLLDNEAAQATATIVDDDGFQVTVETKSVPEGTGSSTDVPVRVRLSHVADQLVDVFVHSVTPSGVRIGFHDVIFAPGETEKVVAYPVTGDADQEGDERIELAPVTWLATDPNLVSGFLTVVDDDAPPAVSVGDLTVAEGDGVATVVFTRTSTAGAVAFDVALENGTATKGDDFGSVSGRVAFPPGDLTTTVSVPITDDALDEVDETFGVRISNPQDAAIADDLGVVTITDDDAAPSVTIADLTVAEGDSGATPVGLAVELSEPSGKTVRLRYATADGTAVAPGDYAAVSSQEVVIPPLATAATAPVDVRGDTDPEEDETFRVVLGDVENATVADGEATVTILDDEPPPTLSIADASVAEGDSGRRTMTFTVTRSHTVGDASFSFITEDGSATPLADYLPHGGVVTFAAGSPTATFAVEVVGDVLDEDDETFGVRLFDVVGAIVADGVAVATIVDDDTTPSLSIDDVSVREGNTGTTVATFTVTLSAPSSKSVTVLAATADGTATAPSDYVAVAPTTLTFAGTTTQTFDVTVNGDVDPEPDETFSVVLSSAVDATLADDQGVGTILEDEAPANDDFAQAAPLHEGTTAFDTSFATIEVGEPGLDPGSPTLFPTVWYRFSPGRGAVELRASRASVYTGTSVGALTLVARTDGSAGVVPIQFPSVEGTEYFVQIVGPSSFFGSGIGRDTLHTVFNPAPSNDDFEDAAPLAIGTTSLDTSFATIEGGEPGLAPLTPHLFPSVWYRLAPGAGGIELKLGALFVNAAHRVTVYTGSELGDLTAVAGAESPSFPHGGSLGGLEVEFMTEAGEEYLVQVLGFSAFTQAGSGGHYIPNFGQGSLELNFHPAPPNDDFTASAPLAAGITAYDTSFAGTEPGEPGLASTTPEAHPSVWYRLSPGRGGVTLRQSGLPFVPKRLSVYTGDSLAGLTLIRRADNTGSFPAPGTTEVSLDFPTAAGEVYLVQVLSASTFPTGIPDVGMGFLSMAFHPSPSNDDFANATPILAAAMPYDTSFATVESGETGLEPTLPELFPSVWYRLAPGLGTSALRAESSDRRQLSVYTGPSLGALTLVARTAAPDPFSVSGPAGPSVELDFRSVCGATYWVQVVAPSAFSAPALRGFDPLAGQGTLTPMFTPTPLPPNDAFADATTLPLGPTTLPAGWWTCMSAEPGEPAHGGAPAARSLWYRATVSAGRLTVDSPGNRVAVYRGSSLGALTRVADGPAGRASVLTAGETFLIAVDGGTGTTVDLGHVPGDVTFGSTASITTDDGPVGATAADPLETTISGTSASAKSLFETTGAAAPSAWTFLTHKVEISAPPLTPPPADPFYTITFRIDGSLIPPFTGPVISRPATTVFKNGDPIAASCAGNPRPDPCVFSVSLGNSLGPGDQQDRVITVRSRTASEWSFGTARRTRGTAAGLLRPAGGGDVEFAVASNGTNVAGALSYGTPSGRFNATSVTALGIDGSKAWLAGVGRDGRPFLAYAEDNGPGSADRFRLWIAGVEQTHADGGLAAGNLVVRPG